MCSCDFEGESQYTSSSRRIVSTVARLCRLPSTHLHSLICVDGTTESTKLFEPKRLCMSETMTMNAILVYLETDRPPFFGYDDDKMETRTTIGRLLPASNPRLRAGDGDNFFSGNTAHTVPLHLSMSPTISLLEYERIYISTKLRRNALRAEGIGALTASNCLHESR